jgi:nitroreductase
MSLETIFARRSIRKYTAEPVTEEEEKTLLEAAMAAPSASNKKPWHFLVVRDRKTLDALAEAHPHAAMLKTATLCVAVCGDPEPSGEYWIQDCAAATENLLLAATALGLGTCWLGVHPRQPRKEAVRPVLGVPDHLEILNLIAVGRPDETKEPRTQFDAARVHRERW